MAKILITEKCNMDCPFCYKPDAIAEQELSIEEVGNISKAFVKAGVTKAKISGGAYGKALVRKDILDVVKAVRAAGMIEIGLATNGKSLTEKKARELADAGVTWVTQSITTLKDETYKILYKSTLPKASIAAVSAANLFERYQINCALMKNINDSEVE